MELPALVTRVRAEFMEMPGLRLSIAEATRLWGMDHSVCSTVLESLVRMDLNDEQRAAKMLKGVKGKRLTYHQTDGA